MRPPWLDVLATPDVLDALREAARDCMRIDDCRPEECQHRWQLMTPLEFYDWLEQELALAAPGPAHRRRREPAGRPGRRSHMELAVRA